MIYVTKIDKGNYFSISAYRVLNEWENRKKERKCLFLKHSIVDTF